MILPPPSFRADMMGVVLGGDGAPSEGSEDGLYVTKWTRRVRVMWREVATRSHVDLPLSPYSSTSV